MSIENIIANQEKPMELLAPVKAVRMKSPVTDRQQEWCTKELANYLVAVQFLAFFFEARANFGDMTEQEVWDEIKANVSMAARGEFDLLGVH